MYLAKENGKARYEIAQPELHQDALKRMVTLSDLRNALEHGEFGVFYQLIVDSPSRSVLGCEALIRWNHPFRGCVLPADFIDAAESSGLIVPLGKWIRNETFRQLAAWRSSGTVDDDFYVSVNLSPRELSEPTLVADVLCTLNAHSVPARNVMLEVTEGSLMRDFVAASAQLRKLKRLGVRLALDDYGTGYSSLNRLANLPIDTVKIDKSFIDRIIIDDSGRAVVQSVIDVANALGMVTVAEGIEDQEQADALQEMGCNDVQGFLFSEPMEPAGLVHVIKQLSSPGTSR
jgi:EAL domain-containing protein (putative c-di-GMP-specific phosphodiesterase class I)